MKLAFVTTQSAAGSTVVGRILPLARELTKHGHAPHLLIHDGPKINESGISIHVTGKDPFTKTESGKKRLSGIFLVARMKWNAFAAAWALRRIQPEVIIISKSLPESVFAVWIARLLRFVSNEDPVIFDIDDFEITANTIGTGIQRAAIHWAERIGSAMASHIVVATPYLQDHFTHIAPKKQITLIPTGIQEPKNITESQAKPFSMLYAGSVSIASGHRVDLIPEIFSRVAQAIPDATLVMAGDGDDTEHIKSLFKEKGLEQKATWHGRYTQNEIPDLFNTASVIIDPIDSSITNRAKSSFRVATASAYGKLAVTSNIGIRPLFIPQALQKTAFAAPGDAADYAEHVIAALQTSLDTNQREALQKQAMRYNWSMLAKMYSELLHD